VSGVAWLWWMWCRQPGCPRAGALAAAGRWLSRLCCTASPAVCAVGAQEAGRLFCPQCGNATMEKVEVTTGPDGAEQYGVRKKHNLRGTRYSLPKPKVTMNWDHLLTGL
jgi:Nin one binding (NOB1) Zn-ribbon like